VGSARSAGNLPHSLAALLGRVFERQTHSHAHAKPWAWHPALGAFIALISWLSVMFENAAFEQSLLNGLRPLGPFVPDFRDSGMSTAGATSEKDGRFRRVLRAFRSSDSSMLPCLS